jgi:ketosteroid isomerase-like protein
VTAEENVAVIRDVVDAWNRGDVDAMMERATEDFEWHPVLVAEVGAGAFHGEEGFRKFFDEWKTTWENWDLDVQELRPVGHQVIAFTQVHAKGQGSGVELDQPIAQLFELRDGKVCRGQTFLDQQEAAAVAEERSKEKA